MANESAKSSWKIFRICSSLLFYVSVVQHCVKLDSLAGTSTKARTHAEVFLTIRLTTMYKIVNGHMTLELPPYVKSKVRQTRQYHPKKFISLASNSNTYKNSFITRTVTDWNSLPANVIDQATVETFKAALKEHFIKLE